MANAGSLAGEAPAGTERRIPKSYHIRVLEELGLLSLYSSTYDVKLLCVQRFVRLFAYGATTLVLVAFMEALGFTKTNIGLFMTLTMAGDVCISFFLTLFADFFGRKAILMLGAALMTGSGVVFALCSNYWILLAAAIFGVISPSGSEIGPFRAVEESVIAHITTPSTRADVYAWYTLFGSAGTAFGLMVCGWVTRSLTENDRFAAVDAYRAVFAGYAALGTIKFLLTALLSGKVESERKRASPQASNSPDQETTALLAEERSDSNEQGADETTKPKRRGISAALPEISRETRSIVVKLCLLFAIDAFSSGLATLSWITYFFRWKYNIDDGTLGSIFFTTSIVSAASILVASSLARRFGNVNTMVFTHLPSDLFLALMPLPDNVFLSLICLFVRDSTKSMDAAPRSAFLAAILLPEERTAMMGLFNVVKCTSQSLGPTITGILVDHGLFWLTFVCAGLGKVVYDIGLLRVFKNHERETASRA